MDQDEFNLNMIPVFSENLITYKQYSNDSFEAFEKNEIEYYEQQIQKEKFVENYQKVFNPFTADNKKDIIMEVNDINNVDDFIVHFQKELDYDYYNKDFDSIIEKIEKRFPYFFNNSPCFRINFGFFINLIKNIFFFSQFSFFISLIKINSFSL